MAKNRMDMSDDATQTNVQQQQCWLVSVTFFPLYGALSPSIEMLTVFACKVVKPTMVISVARIFRFKTAGVL